MAITDLSATGHLSSGQYKRTYASDGSFGAFNAVLKEWYLPGVQDVLNSKRALSRYLLRTGTDVGGKTVHLALNVGRNTGTQYISEGSQLPDPGKQGYRQTSWTTKFNYGRVLFTGQAVAASRRSRGSFVNLMDGEIQGLIRDIQHADNRVFFGNSTGRMARIAAITNQASAVLTLDRPGGITSQALGTLYLEPGMRVCIVKNASETKAIGTLTSGDFVNDGTNAVFKISSIDTANGTITLDNAAALVGVNVGDFLYLASTIKSSSAMLDAYTNRGQECNGLTSIIADSDPPLQSNGLGNVSINDEPLWKAFRVHNGGVPVPFSESMFQQAMDGLDQAGDGVVEFWMTTHGIRRQYAALLTASKRFVNTRELPGGFKALTYNDIPIVVDKDCPRGRIFGIDRSVIKIAYETDYTWVDEDGAVLHRLPDHHAYQATLYRFHELICTARNRLCVIEDIQDS